MAEGVANHIRREFHLCPLFSCYEKRKFEHVLIPVCVWPASEFLGTCPIQGPQILCGSCLPTFQDWIGVDPETFSAMFLWILNKTKGVIR